MIPFCLIGVSIPMLNVQTQASSMMQQRLMMQKLQQKLVQANVAQPKFQAPQARFGNAAAPLVEDTFTRVQKAATKALAPLEGNVTFQMPKASPVKNVLAPLNNFISKLFGQVK